MIAPAHRHDVTKEYENLLNKEQFIMRYLLVPLEYLEDDELNYAVRMRKFVNDLYQEWLDLAILEISEGDHMVETNERYLSR